MAYTSKYTGEEIDAKLDEVKPVDIVDGLESDDSASALSARQGKVLKEMIEGGITEETEVYIGEEAPTDDGAKLWVDTDDESGETSGGNGGSTSGGGSNVFVFPEEVMSDDYTEESPYFFTPEKTAEFLAALENPSSVYVAYQNAGGYIASLHFNIHTVYGFDAVCVSYAMGYLSVMIIHMMMEDDIAKAYKETQIKEF